ncbi:MAG TPA: hypothetical protein VIT23_12435 [Terrimicrobiaceae bacterium]
MSWSYAVLVLLTSVLIIGCATSEPPPSPSTEAAEQRDMRAYRKDYEGRIP